MGLPIWAKLKSLNNLGILDGLTLLGPGQYIFVKGGSGSDANSGDSPDNAVKSLSRAHDLAVSGRGDTVVMLTNGGTGESVRLTSTLTWSKNNTHLVGLCAPSYNNRARIATLSGATAFAAFVKVTATGCIFRNFSLFNDNAIAAQITWQDQGGRNYYEDVFFGGMGDTTSAGSTTSRVLKLGGSGASGENIFRRCTIGLDTRSRTVANATLEFAGSSKRNVFDECLFPIHAGATTALTIISSGTNPLETFQMFRRCVFHNPYPQSSALLQAALATLAANGNGRLVLNDCSRFGITHWGTDATSLAQIYTDAPAAGSGVTSGQAVVSTSS
jgi:hypothetical protein